MKNKLIKWLMMFFVIGVLFFSIVVVVTFTSMHSSVSKTCNIAQEKYSNTNCVDSMILILESDDTSFSDKNKAIWVLGQLADKRALPTLKTLYKDGSTVNEPLDKNINNYELSKAIRWCERENLTSWMYKSFR